MTRFKPEAMTFEVGLFGGMFWPSKNHNIIDEVVMESTDPNEGHRPYKTVSGELGLRLGFYPLTFAGIEAEGAFMTQKTVREASDGINYDGKRAIMMTARGSLVAQVPFWSITPFALVGFGRLAVDSERLGKDGDPAFHFGVGVKVPVNRFWGLRLDFRDTLTQKAFSDKDTATALREGLTSGDVASAGDVAHHLELLLGITGTFGRSVPPPKQVEPPPPPPPLDTDGDGFIDDVDACPTVPGVAPDGCPIPDTDGDGILDDVDKCVNEPGPPPDGCPLADTDNDGYPDIIDGCPEVFGTVPDGCPKPVPPEVEKFSGTIEGIQFDTGSARIRASSNATLDEAVAMLKKWQDVRISIEGHTDDVGNRERNIKLSQDRAESVKRYLVSKGIDPSRLETKGHGPDKPVAEGKTPAARQKNRRTEFVRLNY